MKKYILILPILMSCFSAFTQKNVSVLYNGEFDFASLKTFDFSKSTYQIDLMDIKFSDQTFLAMALIDNLKSKGVAKTKDKPDAIIDVKFSYKELINVHRQPHNIYSRYYAAPRYRGRYVGTVTTSSIEQEVQASLVISIIDQKSGKTVWTGYWKGEPDLDMSLKKRNKKVNKAIAKMFKEYPVE